jgi:hypothetical protein
VSEDLKSLKNLREEEVDDTEEGTWMGEGGLGWRRRRGMCLVMPSVLPSEAGS